MQLCWNFEVRVHLFLGLLNPYTFVVGHRKIPGGYTVAITTTDVGRNNFI